MKITECCSISLERFRGKRNKRLHIALSFLFPKMKLLTHNMLQCNVKGCTSNNFPLAVKATEVSREETEFRPEFIKHLIPKIDYAALAQTAREVIVPPCDEMMSTLYKSLLYF
jgi:hypothetical protein